MALHLTFDDGPEPALTPWVLEALDAHEALATFFVLGAKVRAAPGLLEEILERGHRVELHGDAHLDHRSAQLPDLTADTAVALATLAEHDVAPQWWRVPWGRPGPHTRAIADHAGLRIAGWDADTHDWRGDTWATQPMQVREAGLTGGVVLLHDGFGPGAQRTDGANTLALIDGLLGAAVAHGMPAAPLPDADELEALAVTDTPGTPPSRQQDRVR